MDPRGDGAVARGYVTALDIVSPRRRERRWHGAVHYLRGDTRLRKGIGELWLLRFVQGSELRWVEVLRVRDSWTPSGRRATAQVVSYDEQVPSVVTELGGE